ncbi:MAG TPA: ADP-ribosylation factor-like protein, partial [Sandaracinaceae bacterium LLY-WYZ-13_1]|nr:ADP-ribosylation factor-like protein [Sandaracinaceae bacterium LLY-WYZ-13_1]
MAAYDADERKVVVRVVYDGPGFAGKTTNLRKLEEFFTERRRSGLASPGEREGRTLLFDWMHLDGGLVAGHGLRCQLVTVPGQWALRERRLHLLSTADAVVFVCEATEAGLGAARPQLDSLREHLAARAPEDVPLVLQLNKQDLPGAVEEPAARARLEVSEAMPLVAARAREGTGVRETVVLAIRAAANRVQQQLLAGGLDELGRLESRPELRAALETLAPREETAPGEAAPGEAAPGEAAPDEAAPDEAAPDEAAPGEAAPDEAAPGEAAPEGGGAVELRLAERRAPRPASAAPQTAPPARPARQPIVRPASS